MTLTDRDFAASAGSSSGQELRQRPTPSWQPREQWQGQPNVSGNERTVSLASGAILTLLGLARRDLPGLLIAGVGGAMLHRGATGRCYMYKALGVNTADEERQAIAAGRAKPGTHVTQAFLVNRPAQELYDYWHNFENLPRIMSHLESVRVLDERRSHWVAKAPGIAGGKVEWDAETVADEPGRRIEWRSLPGADVDNAGSVEFLPAPGDRGTIVRVVTAYRPPAGLIGKWIAKLSGEKPEQQIRDDLRKFKRIMEVGEAPTTEGQPHGTCAGLGMLRSS